MAETLKRRGRKARPGIEKLEGRSLLSGVPPLTGPGGILLTPREINTYLQRSQGPKAVPIGDRFISYMTPRGGRVSIFLHGDGSLKGTSVNPDGSLNLVYGGTNSGSAISANVQGGGGRALLASIRDANSAPGDFSGVGSEPLSLVKMRNFELIPGGSINLTGGVGLLLLNTVDANSQIHLKATQAPSFTPLRKAVTVSSTFTPSGGVSVPTSSTNTPASTTASAGATQAFGFGTLASGAPGGLAVPPSLGGGAVLTIGAYPSLGAQFVPSFTTTPSIGGTVPGVNTASATGQAINISTTTNTSTPSAATAGGTVAGTTASTTSSTTTNTQPPGADIIINHINGPALSTPLGDPQIFGIDPVTNSLIRFDAKTGDALQTISLAGLGTAIGGAAMGRDNGNLVALVTNGSMVQAYNAVNGSFVGQFSTANLASVGLTRIDGLGSTNTQTVVSDSSAGTLGLAQIIDVTASLASGQAVPVGAAYSPVREFELSGGSTGLAGSDLIYEIGAAHLDPKQPKVKQIGILALNASSQTLSENARGALPGSNSAFVDAGPAGTARSRPFQALGSVESNLALVTGVSNGENNVTLYNPTTLAAAGAINLKDPNQLSGLSESFHPEIAGSALIDTNGEINSVRIQTAKGMVFNSAGALNYLQIGRAVDSAVVARPLGNVSIGSRKNLLLLSTTRPQGTKNGVTVNENLPVIGPLALP